MANASVPDLAGVIRRKIETSGLSMLQLSKRGGLPYQTVHGFVTQGRDITLRSASKMCGVLGLELHPAMHENRSLRNRKRKTGGA